MKEGLLLIEGSEMRRWKKRWTVLRREKEEAFLYFYKVDDFINKSSHLGSLNVNTCSIFQYPAKPYSFELVFPPYESQTGFIQPAEHFRFQALNNEERDSWVAALTPFTRPVEEMHQNLIIHRRSLQYDLSQVNKPVPILLLMICLVLVWIPSPRIWRSWPLLGN